MHTVTKAYISLAALRHNLSQVRLLVGELVEIMPVVKANAYGHGVRGVCQALAEAGLSVFGVATIDEGLSVKGSLPNAKVVLLGGSLPDQAEAVVEAGLWPVVYDLDQARALDREARRLGKDVPVHLKIDTGMARLGVRYDEALAFLSRLRTLSHVAVVGLMTHLATADAQDSSFAKQQLDRFDSFVSSSGLLGQVVVHAANSAAVMKYSRSHYDMVRPGLMLYGLSPTGATPPGITLLPALRLTSRVVRVARLRPGECVGYGQTFVAVRDMQVATVPIGYADGYDYRLTGQAEVLIRGVRCPVVGAVSMDMIAVGIGESCQVSAGDEVVIIGEQMGESITVNELAFLAQTIPYEILCGLSERIDRVYLEG
ncbi:MAG: alanine racemase [Candidatus Coatesbacteria bacterium]|nr:alanine racemase [Candidatus Coatesbacteria bacterium]